MNRIPICYCGNRKIFGGIFMSILSIIDKTDSPLEIILLTMDLTDKNSAYIPFSEEQRALLERILKEKNPESTARIIDVTDLQRKYFTRAKNQKNSYTPYASIRLFLDLLDVPEKLIYLDADIMCLKDIRTLYDTDIEGYEFGAAVDIVGRHFFGKTYCNSGVLLINLAKIRETDLFEKARIRVRDKFMMMPDQSAINFLSTSKLILPYSFNEQRAIKEDTVLKHFCMGYKWYGPILTSYNFKQWHRDRVHKAGIYCFEHIYERFDEILASLPDKSLISI